MLIPNVYSCMIRLFCLFFALTFAVTVAIVNVDDRSERTQDVRGEEKHPVYRAVLPSGAGVPRADFPDVRGHRVRDHDGVGQAVLSSGTTSCNDGEGERWDEG